MKATAIIQARGTRVAPVTEYKLDKIDEQHDISILRTPPYHPELQSFDTRWAVVKNHMPDNCDVTLAGLRKRLPEAFAKVTPNTCEGIISKVFEQEEKYWAEDEKLAEIYSKNAEEEYLGKDAFESQGDEFYLKVV